MPKRKLNEIIIKGDVIESFERVENITNIILLGDKGGIRNIEVKESKEVGYPA